MYFLPVVLDGGIVVDGGFVAGGFFVATLEAAASFVGAFPFPFILLLVGVILRGAPLLKLFIHPMMRPPSLDCCLTPAICGIAGVSFLFIRLRDFSLVISNLLGPRKYCKMMGRVVCTSCVVEDGVGVRTIAR